MKKKSYCIKSDHHVQLIFRKTSLSITKSDIFKIIQHVRKIYVLFFTIVLRDINTGKEINRSIELSIKMYNITKTLNWEN